MPGFTVSQSQVELESRFEPRLWALVHDTPSLYEALLRNLGPLGLAATDVRPITGDGSIGSAGLEFWLFAFQATIRLRLESFTAQCNSLTRVGRDQFISLVGGTTAAIEQASRSAFKFRGHTLSYSCHGTGDGMKSAEFIRQFAPQGPKIEQMGESIASGTALYYGPAEPVLSSIVTLDPSRVIDGGLFLRVVIITDGSLKTADEITRFADARFSKVFAALNLDVKEWWS